MKVESFFNELSMPVGSSIEEGRRLMSNLIATSVALTKAGATRGIRTKTDINHIELSAGYPIARWRNDREVSKEEQRYFTSLITKYPYLEDPDLEDRAHGCECKVNGETSEGLLAAFLNEGLGLSFRTAPPWEPHLVPVEIHSMVDNGPIVAENFELNHGSHPDHAAIHAPWIAERLRFHVESGRDLAHKLDRFPRIHMCDSALNDIADLAGNSPHLKQFVKKLKTLSAIAADWNEGGFPYDRVGFEVKNESEATLNQFSQERTFTIRNGQARVFEEHFDLPSGWRVHIYVDPESREVSVGYVGTHLRTARFN